MNIACTNVKITSAVLGTHLWPSGVYTCMSIEHHKLESIDHVFTDEFICLFTGWLQPPFVVKAKLEWSCSGIRAVILGQI